MVVQIGGHTAIPGAYLDTGGLLEAPGAYKKAGRALYSRPEAARAEVLHDG